MATAGDLPARGRLRLWRVHRDLDGTGALTFRALRLDQDAPHLAAQSAAEDAASHRTRTPYGTRQATTERTLLLTCRNCRFVYQWCKIESANRCSSYNTTSAPQQQSVNHTLPPLLEDSSPGPGPVSPPKLGVLPISSF